MGGGHRGADGPAGGRIADGDGAAEPPRARLRDEAARRDALTAELKGFDPAALPDVEALVRDVRARTANLRELLGRHATKTRQILRLMLGGAGRLPASRNSRT
jgi:hypothetical protein